MAQPYTVPFSSKNESRNWQASWPSSCCSAKEYDLRCRANTFAAEAGLKPGPEPCSDSQVLVDPLELGSAPDKDPELSLRPVAHAGLATLDVHPVVKALKACPKACRQDPIPLCAQGKMFIEPKKLRHGQT